MFKPNDIVKFKDGGLNFERARFRVLECIDNKFGTIRTECIVAQVFQKGQRYSLHPGSLVLINRDKTQNHLLTKIFQ